MKDEQVIADGRWEAIPGPPESALVKMRQSLVELSDAAGPVEARAAHSHVLSSVGNNHQGTFYPAAVYAVPHLLAIAEANPSWPRWAALNVLIDLSTSFAPEAGYEYFVGSDGQNVNVADTIRRQLVDARELIRRFAMDEDLDESAQAAAELLALLAP